MAKLIKDNSDLFAEFICINLNDSIAESTFPSLLKLAGIKPQYIKKIRKHQKITRSVSTLSNIPKIYEIFCLSKCQNISNHSFQNFIAVLGKVLTPSSIFCQCLRILFKRFMNNQMKSNSTKSHFVYTTNDTDDLGQSIQQGTK